MVYIYTMYLAFLNESTYRANIVFTILREILTIFIMISVWTALYEGRGTVNGRTFNDMVLYVLAVHSCRNMTCSNLYGIVHTKITTGSIASDFIRPVSIMLSMMADQIGRNIFKFIFSVVPVLITGIIFFHPSPVLPANVIFFVISILMGMTLMLQLSWIISMMAFWTKNGVFGRMLTGSLVTVFGGTVIPVWFYPPFMRTLCSVLPFSYMFFYPAGILMGRYGLLELIKIYGIQLLWIGIMIVIERVVWNNARKVVTVQGG